MEKERYTHIYRERNTKRAVNKEREDMSIMYLYIYVKSVF